MTLKKYKFLVLFFLLLLPFSATALEVDIESSNMVLYNLNEKKIIAAKGENEQVSIASMTKIMTTLVAIEHITNMDEQVTLTNKVFEGLVEANASVAGFRLRQKVTYRDLVYGAFLPSGADATNALALFLAGGQDSFVGWMNEKAQNLGLTNTHFVNTSGLDAEGHYSTVNEVAILLREALKNETFKEVFETKTYVTSDGSMTFHSTLSSTLSRNHLQADYILGAKTGYTYDAGRCLASIAYDKTHDIYYLLVTARAPINPNYYHVTDAIHIYEYYFQNYGYEKVYSKGEPLFSFNTKDAKEDSVTISMPEDVSFYLKSDYSREDFRIDYEGISTITPKMNVGDLLGTIHISYQGEEVKTLPIVLEQKVTFSYSRFLKERPMLIIGFCFLLIVLLILARIFFYCMKLRKNHKRLRFKRKKKK